MITENSDGTRNEVSEMSRVKERRQETAAERDARMERSIRIAMAAVKDTAGNCQYCGKPLERDGDVLLHPMPYLDCPGPQKIDERTHRAVAPPVPRPKDTGLEVEIKPVRRERSWFDGRDEDDDP